MSDAPKFELCEPSSVYVFDAVMHGEGAEPSYVVKAMRNMRAIDICATTGVNGLTVTIGIEPAKARALCAAIAAACDAMDAADKGAQP